MELLINKYKPKNFEEIGFGDEANNRLKSIAKEFAMPHLLISGRRGSGKHTRALLFLQEKFGNAVNNMRKHTIEVKVPNKTEPIVLNILLSPYHYQINPSIHGVYDRVLLQKFIDTIIKIKTIDKNPYRIVIIEDADSLTQEAQQSLRRTLETRIKTCRFIFLVNNTGHVIDPIYSRCAIVNVPSPTVQEITEILDNISEKESISNTSHQINNAIARKSDRNIAHAINTMQKIAVKKTQIKKESDIEDSDEKRIANEIISLMIKGKDLLVFVNIRKKINELLVNNVSGTHILHLIFKSALAHVPKNQIETIYNICSYATNYDNTIRMGGKSVYHLEAFCLSIFREFKTLMSGA